MLKYILKRLLIGLVTILMLITVTFVLTHIMPGNPFNLDNLNAKQQEEMIAHYGLDRPIGEQLVQYLTGLLHGDFGISYKKSGTTVASVISAEAPMTLRLGAAAFVTALILGTVIGIWMAVTKHETVSNALLGLSTLGVSVPNFVLALILMKILGVKLGWFHVMGINSPADYVLPVTALAVYPIAQISRLVKTSYTESMRQDYVVMARAKGLKTPRIVLLHVLKNAMIPVITASGPMIAFLLTGSFVVENQFSIHGIGWEFVNAVSNRDYTMILGLTVFMGITIIVCNLIADILCAAADPRMKISG